MDVSFAAASASLPLGSDSASLPLGADSASLPLGADSASLPLGTDSACSLSEAHLQRLSQRPQHRIWAWTWPPPPVCVRAVDVRRGTACWALVT